MCISHSVVFVVLKRLLVVTGYGLSFVFISHVSPWCSTYYLVILVFDLDTNTSLSLIDNTGLKMELVTLAHID